jgi:flagellar biogenesis protein FliO
MRALSLLLVLWSASSFAEEATGATAAPAAAPAPIAAPAPAAAPQFVPEPEIPKSEPPELVGEELNLGWTLLRTMAVLGMVIMLVYLTLNVGLRKLLGIKPPVGTAIVTVLERVPLDQKRSLFVIEAAGEVLLVGGADSSLSLISKLDPAEVAKLRAAPAATPAVLVSPLLQKLLGRRAEPEKVPTPAAANSSPPSTTTDP